MIDQIVYSAESAREKSEAKIIKKTAETPQPSTNNLQGNQER